MPSMRYLRQLRIPEQSWAALLLLRCSFGLFALGKIVSNDHKPELGEQCCDHKHEENKNTDPIHSVDFECEHSVMLASVRYEPRYWCPYAEHNEDAGVSIQTFAPLIHAQ